MNRGEPSAIQKAIRQAPGRPSAVVGASPVPSAASSISSSVPAAMYTSAAVIPSSYLAIPTPATNSAASTPGASTSVSSNHRHSLPAQLFNLLPGFSEGRYKEREQMMRRAAEVSAHAEQDDSDDAQSDVQSSGSDSATSSNTKTSTAATAVIPAVTLAAPSPTVAAPAASHRSPRSPRQNILAPASQHVPLSGPVIAASATVDGWLKKKGENNPIWKRRFCVLRNNKFHYYEDASRTRLLGTVPVQENMLVRVSPPSSHFHQALNLWNPNRYFQIDLPLRTYYFYADALEDVQKWIDALNYCIAHLKPHRRAQLGRPSPTILRPVSVAIGVSDHSGTVPVTVAGSVPPISTALSMSSRDRVPMRVSWTDTSSDLSLQEPFAGPKRLQLSTDGESDGEWVQLSASASAAPSSSPLLLGETTATANSSSARKTSPGAAADRAVAGGYVDISAVLPAPAPHHDGSRAITRSATLSPSSSGNIAVAALRRSATEPVGLPSQTTSASSADEASCEIDLSAIKLLDKLGEGAFGEVYRTVLWEKEVAVKILRDAYDEQHRTELEHEVAILRSLRHPNCVLFIGYCRKPFSIVTECMQNGALYALLHNPSVRLSSSQMIKITVEIALAMNYLHQHQPVILHRDLKSSNVLISESWTVKVSDFGLAELRGAQGLPAHCGAVQWRAPEVSESFFHAPGDVFSFGVTIWELLTRQEPWKGMEFQEVARRVRAGERPPIPPSDATGLQADLIQRCWHADPAHRPTFQQVLEYLKPLIDDDINVMQLRSHPEIYLNNDNAEYAAIKLVRKSRQGFYYSLPAFARHCRVWSAMLQPGMVDTGVQLLREHVVPIVSNSGSSYLYLLNDYHKLKLIVYFRSSELLRQLDQAVTSLPKEKLPQMFSQLYPCLCTPLIRENLELVEFGLHGRPTVAQELHAVVSHERSRAYDSFERLVANTFATWPSWLGSLLISDHSTGAFSLVTFFAAEAELRELERTGMVHQLVTLFRDYYSVVPTIEHYRVVAHSELPVAAPPFVDA